MMEPSEDNLDRMCTREVTGVFHSQKTLIDAAEELLVAGNDRADIDVSASVDELDRRLNYQAIPAADLADMAITPRQSFMGIDDALSAEAVAGSVAGCIVAIAVAAILIARDTEPLYVGIFSILSGVVVCGIALTRVRRQLYRERTLGLEKQSEWKGLLIWVRARSPEKEAEAQEILIRHGAQAVHVHEIELVARPNDGPLHSLRIDPWLGDERLGQP
ncbi:MAG: hypothetical protein JWR80_6615 [Bradyrhizobium sp.]|nr:hypothetical protein [Bradyrhizobium sp.]